jgi:hypothetical protein
MIIYSKLNINLVKLVKLHVFKFNLTIKSNKIENIEIVFRCINLEKLFKTKTYYILVRVVVNIYNSVCNSAITDRNYIK